MRGIKKKHRKDAYGPGDSNMINNNNYYNYNQSYDYGQYPTPYGYGGYATPGYAPNGYSDGYGSYY